MSRSLLLRFLADGVLLLHLGVVMFVVGGLVLIVVGNLRSWRWVNGLGFRIAHLAAIGVVVAESWFGVTCPLTTLESWLRGLSGSARYNTGFIEHWVGRLLFYDAPAWAFVAGYTVFALLVLAVWWRYPPRRRRAGLG